MEYIGAIVEISEQIILKLVEGQGRIEQAVQDLKESIPSLVVADKENAEAIKGVERKIWYFGGAGSVLGYVGSHLVEKWLHIGGK